MENKQRCGVALLLCACFALFALTPGAAQLRNQRRVTALQLGEAAEGSRVTIVSDSALNDYEAFRRGDRFYVKIPQADFASGLPRLRADGFEDVQVQKVGDSLIVSFKLQLGAAARVDQHANRLDVIFTAPNRGSYNSTATRVSRVENTQSSIDRGRDAAGPIPPGSVGGSRDRFVTDRAADQTFRNPRGLTNPQSASNKSSKGATNSQPGKGNVALSSPSPVASPTSAATPRTPSPYSPVLSATPAASPAARPGDSGGLSNWKRRSTAALQWAWANRLATLLGALILFSLILYLVLALRNRQKKVVKEKRAQAPKVQPKFAQDAQLSELPSPPLNVPNARPAKEVSVASEARSEAASGASIGNQPDIRGEQVAKAPTAAANASRGNQGGLTKPAITAPIATPDVHSSEEEEREVFEL